MENCSEEFGLSNISPVEKSVVTKNIKKYEEVVLEIH